MKKEICKNRIFVVGLKKFNLKLENMLQIIFKQLNKPTEANFRKLSIIAYDLTNLEYYNNYVSNYYSAALKQDFFSQFWILRNEVKQLIK